MNGLIRFSLANPRAVTVLMLTIVFAGVAVVGIPFGIYDGLIPRDILPVYRSPAVQVLTFYNGMPASSVEADITSRMERWVGQAAGTRRQESRSIIGASIIRNYYSDDTDPSAALTQVNSLATAAIPNLPPGTLPPVILPFDPTSATPVCLVALNSRTQDESTLYDTGRYQVRNMIMASPGSNAPVVYGGRLRTVLAFLDREKMQARNLSPVDVMNALDHYNIFLPAGDAKLGWTDYALDSNSMYELVDRMGDIPVKSDPSGKMIFLRDVAIPKDSSLVQTNIVRVDGRRQVYIPVYRQQGASTLTVVGNLRKGLPDMTARLTTPDVNLKLVMDQSVYVSNAIESLTEEGILGAFLCSMVILLFLGEWRMTMIAVMTIPVAVLGALACLFGIGQSVNVMTLAGLALAIGPLVDSAIICLENTHRHLGLGAKPREAAFLGASEVAMPELIASLCTLLVLLPLAMMPGLGAFLFRPMFFAVAFAMTIAYILSRTFVPARCAAWLSSHAHPPVESHTYDWEHRSPHEPRKWWITRAFEKWEGLIEIGIAAYTRALAVAMRFRGWVIGGAFATLALVVVVFGLNLRREFFPEVDAGAFEVYVRTTSGTRIEVTEAYVEAVEAYIKKKLGSDLEIVISEIGLTADWSAAFTQNAGPMDAVLKVQLIPERSRSAQECVAMLRKGFAEDNEFEQILQEVYTRRMTSSTKQDEKLTPDTPPFTRANLEFAFDAGGMIRSAMNEGRSTPINVRITTKNLPKARRVADGILSEVRQIDGVVDARIIQRLDYPEYVIDVDQSKAAALGLTQTDVMRNIVAAFNSSVQFNKHNFWIDPKSHNQYYVGVQYPEGDIKSLETLLNIPITGGDQRRSIPLRNMVTIRKAAVPSEVVHTNLQPTIDLTMGVQGRDLGHVAADVAVVVAKYGKVRPDGGWAPFDPDSKDQKPMEGSKLTMTGEYQKMQDTFQFQALGMIGAIVLIYFLMVALFKSYLTPLVVLSAVPVGVTGVILMLFATGTALNVQSLLGVIFMVGIVVSNTVLLTDFAENLRKADRIPPTEAIRRAAAIRVRPVVMTALATFFALIPMSLGLARGSEANVPLGRAVLGGLLAGLATTLFVVPCVYSLIVPNKFEEEEEPLPGEPGHDPKPATHHATPEELASADTHPA
ncbi:efflux RND transporter permease subunit [Fimbriiglobus ruber]|uniref:Cobalt-zinc-cadmium resistance protein CzcA / Cation efflux system protein CusA n=1 Tax=Fimbriiglobus ruber TaxID=1908690 RepID=A0A225DPF9_9BACT|nr:efflux RND transporter permease subunit [Fimbriiglobus ruber]OWK43360.1 Cobalt-zinc-cadmium resistance protein CzcA / Cation efflux system protein CusA [Fimbriiglobus ruber]